MRGLVLTGALVQHVVEGAVGHPVCDDDGVGRGRSLATPQHGQHVWMGEYPGMSPRRTDKQWGGGRQEQDRDINRIALGTIQNETN